MKVLSIDVGIKHLALCLLDQQGNKHVTIDIWDVLDISKEETFLCMETDKNGICNRPAKFKKNGSCFCPKHAKKQKYFVPSSEMKLSSIKKMTWQSLTDLVNKYQLPLPTPCKKQDLIHVLEEYICEFCFEPVTTTSAKSVDLICIGRNIKTKLDALFFPCINNVTTNNVTIDTIVIENQISPIANRMKTIQGMIAQYFIMRIPKANIVFVSASNKLKSNTSETTKTTTTYAERKKLGIKKTDEWLQEHPMEQEWYTLFQKSKKRDDLADSFLQGLWYINFCKS